MQELAGFTNVFYELSLVLFAATVFGIVLKIFKQPVILAYILAGAIVGFIGLSQEVSAAAFEFFGRIGIALLLFMVGIELSFDSLKRIGRTVLLTTLGQIATTTFLVFVISQALGFSTVSSLYLGIAAAFSSTIVVVKLLTERKTHTALFGRISIGILLTQDLVAVLLIIVLSGFATPSANVFLPYNLFVTILTGLSFVFAIAFLARFFLPKVFNFVSPSGELLFLTAISWAFAMASVASAVGFTFEIGAFLAGLAIANNIFRFQISAKIRPLLDFFIVFFFIALGLKITSVWGLSQIVISALILSIVVLLAKPLIILTLLTKVFGHKRRTAFLSAVSLSQISEFSLIIVVLGAAIGHLSGQIVALVALTALITIAVSSVGITHSLALYKKLGRFLGVMEPKHPQELAYQIEKQLRDHVVLVGCDRMGNDILTFLKHRQELGENFVVVDFNPEIVESLAAQNIAVIFGDIADPEIIEKLNLHLAKLVISTIPGVEDNLIVISSAKKANPALPVFVTTSQTLDGVHLYDQGADFVTVPRLTAGKHLARILADNWDDLGQVTKLKEKHLAELWERRHL